jgi:hypothetical protein
MGYLSFRDAFKALKKKIFICMMNRILQRNEKAKQEREIKNHTKAAAKEL